MNTTTTFIIIAICSSFRVLCAQSTSEFDIRDEAEFRKCVPAGAKLEKIAGGLSVFREPSGHANGNTLDNEGRLWCTGDGGVRIMRPDGTLIGILLVPTDGPTNCCFGGDEMQTLFITARPSVYAIHVAAKGVR